MQLGTKKSYRIMLVVCPYEGEVGCNVTHDFYKNKAVKYMPLGVLSLTSCIMDNHEVTVLDASSRGLTLDETIAEIEAWQPDILGLSVVTYRAWAMTQILDRTTAPIKVVGGPHATYNAEFIIQQGADTVFVGDAEVTFPKWLQEGCQAGIFRGEPVPLDDLPLPARHIMDMNDYKIVPNKDMLFYVGELRLPMYSSKGCPMKCIYCDVQQKTFNFKSPERCAEEFQSLIDMGATSVHILDDAFNIRKDRVVGMCEALIKRDIHVDWSARGTVEIRESVIEALAAAGCKRLHVGIESLDDETLIYFKKSCRYKHIKQFCDLCAKHGIALIAYFIIGAPMETDTYRRDLPKMVDDLGIKFPYFNVLSPLAETPYYYDMLKIGKFKRDHWRDFCANPIPGFQPPRLTTDAEDKNLRDVVEGYLEYFKRPDSHVFVT